MSANEPAQSTAAAAQQGDHLQESEAWLLASRSSSTHSDCSATSTSGSSNCAGKERPHNAIDAEGDEDEHNKYEEAPVYVIGTVKTTTEAIELIRRNQRLAEEYEQQMSRTHRRQDARGNTAANTAKKKEQGDKDKEDEEDEDDDFVDWDDDFVYLRVPNVVMSDNDEDDGDGERSEAADRPHTQGEKAAAASATTTTTTTTMPTHHDLPATLREFRERARYTVTLAIARRAVLDDALGGFAKEVEQERAALRAMRHAYEAWKAEQHLHVSHKAKGSEEEEQQQRQQAPGEDTRKDAEQPQQQQRQEEKKEETTQVHVDAHAAMNESGAAVGTGEEKADTQATEPPPPPLHSSRNALQSAPEVNAELRYRTFLQERAFCDSRLPQFLRLAAPPDVLTRMNTSNAAVSHEMPEHTAMPGPNNARPSLLRLFFANTSAAEGYPGAMTPTTTTTTTTTSSSSQDNEHTAGQHKPVVRREWIFVWKQFLRDIHREVFLIENVGYHDADLAAAALLSYLEHCYSRGQAELEQRRRAQAEGSNNNSNNSNTAAAVAASSGHDETSVSTQSPSRRSESQSGGEGKQKEEPKEEASSAAASAAASPSANNNALVLRGLMAAGALGLHAALPPFMRLPLTALVRSVQERHTALARLRSAPRTIKSRKGSVELYPRDEARRAMLLYEAARTVLLAGQQSFMAFPYQLLYEQVGMNRLAGAVPYEEEEEEEDESEASASSKEAEGEKKAEEREVAPAKEDALPVCDVVSEDARVAEDSSELPGSPLRTTTPAETTPAATNRTANEAAAGNNTTATKEAEGHDTTPDITVQNAEKEAEEAEEQQKSESHAQKAEAAAARWRRRRARMQDRPLMIGEPNSDEFCRFLRRIRARVRARDEHVRRTHGTSGHETGKTSDTGASGAHASLFREDVDGSVYLIPAPVIPLSITNAPQQQQAAAAAASEAKAQDSSEATTLLRRGTRIHVYYSETQGLPMVCVSKVFRLATLQPRATPKTSETPEQVKLRRKEMAGMVVLLLMQVQFALFTEEEVEVRWRWYVL